MFTIHTIKSTECPEKFISLNNGYWYYNYNITNVTVEEINPDEEVSFKDGYGYSYIKIQGQPTYPKCFEAVLKEYKNEENTSLFDYYSLNIENELISTIEYKVKVDFGLEKEKSELELAKEEVIKKIEEYDTSENVNSFTFNGNKVWLDKNTRVGLVNSLNIEKSDGKKESTLWFDNIKYEVNIDSALYLLGKIELYALECFNVTAQHKFNVLALEDIESVKFYDITAGYPEQIVASI